MDDATTTESAYHNGHRQRLRKRFLNSGFAGFADHKIVELFLTLCIPRRDVKAAAKTLLQRFGSLRAILDAAEPDQCAPNPESPIQNPES